MAEHKEAEREWGWVGTCPRPWLEEEDACPVAAVEEGAACTSLSTQRQQLGVQVGVGRAGGRLAAGAYQTTGKCQCLLGHLSPPPGCWPPSAYTEGLDRLR